MTSLDDIILKPRNGKVFYEKQGGLFLPLTYRYESSDGLNLRSREECDWHYILCRNGILHTYEPRIASKRPDFGVGNNFLLEICGMVRSPFHSRYELGKEKKYRQSMDEKRKLFLGLGYNLFELYQSELVLNSHLIRDVKKVPFILSVIKRYSRDYACQPRKVYFRPIKTKV